MPRPSRILPHLVFLAACVFASGFAIPDAAAQVRVDNRTLPEPLKLKRIGKREALLAIPRFREELRQLLDGLAQYAESRDSHFVFIGRAPLGL
ncbi:MAG: hypothetical protein JXQ84_02870, partial [Rhodospirillaceae bacterium]|nr:hypothetical protein [Rhodospirillaceae bacterium]